MNALPRFGVFAAFLSLTAFGHASGEPVGVVYPETESRNLEQVFDTIISGVEDMIGGDIDKYTLERSFDSAELAADIKDNENKVLLVLGVRSRKAVNQLKLPIPVVVGAVLSETEEPGTREVAGISHRPDPKILIEKLLSFAPRIREVTVVFNPGKSQSIIDEAAKAAREIGLKLDPRPVHDLRESALMYREIAESVDPQTQAVWLLDHSTIDDSFLMSLLEKAWDRRFIVFSSGIDHAKRGALFSMYPDDYRIGRELGRLANNAEKTAENTGISSLKLLKTAVNMRTAKHLGIDLPQRVGESYDLAY